MVIQKHCMIPQGSVHNLSFITIEQNNYNLIKFKMGPFLGNLTITNCHKIQINVSDIIFEFKK